MKSVPYWLDMPYAPRLSLGEDKKVDVVVVGGGITGVSAAYHCARAGLKTVLIEQSSIASGSAGKNGGMMVEGLAIDFKEAVETFGKEKAAEIWKRTKESREHAVSLIQEESVECDFERPGSLYFGYQSEDKHFLEAELAERKACGFSGEIISLGNGTALQVKEDCMLQPALFVRGLAKVAEEKYGLEIFENTQALSYDAFNVVTSKGKVEAQHVVIAIESNKNDLLPEEGYIRREVGVMTEPFSDEQFSQSLNGFGGMFWTASGNYISCRKVGNRLFLNCGVPLESASDDFEIAQEKISQALSSCFPVFSTPLPVSYFWTGYLLYPKRYLPFISKKEGYYELFGNGGNGLTNGVMLGKLISEYLAAGKEIPDLYQE